MWHRRHPSTFAATVRCLGPRIRKSVMGSVTESVCLASRALSSWTKGRRMGALLAIPDGGTATEPGLEPAWLPLAARAYSRASFTEQVAAIPTRPELTWRLRDDTRVVVEHIWCLTGAAHRILFGPQSAARALRGKPVWARDQVANRRVFRLERWHIRFVDATDTHGLLELRGATEDACSCSCLPIRRVAL